MFLPVFIVNICIMNGDFFKGGSRVIQRGRRRYEIQYIEPAGNDVRYQNAAREFVLTALLFAMAKYIYMLGRRYQDIRIGGERHTKGRYHTRDKDDPSCIPYSRAFFNRR